MEYKHDNISKHGFDINPEILAHDLTMLKLYKSDSFNNEDGWELYELYTEQLATIKGAIEDRIRYDKN